MDAETLKPPESVLILGYNFKLEFKDDMLAVGKCYGYMNADLNDPKIMLDAKSTPLVIADTVLHEIMHAIYMLTALKGKHKEEKTVTMLATHIAVVHNQNPKFSKWWHSLIMIK